MKHPDKTYALTYDSDGTAYVDGVKVEGNLQKYMQKRREEDVFNANMIVIHQVFCDGCESGYERACRYSTEDKLNTKDEEAVRYIIERFNDHPESLKRPIWLKAQVTAEILTGWANTVNNGLIESV